MKRFIYFLLIFFLCQFSLSAQTVTIAKHPAITSHLQLLTTWIEEQRAYYGWPGIAVGIVYDQDLIWSAGFGFADLEKGLAMTPETVFRIASITKLFTCTAMMQLRDQGKLRLDDPVQKFLPWFKIQNPFSNSPAITIRQLMTHTAGLPREAAFPYWTDHQFPTLEEIIQKLPNQELTYPPETRWKYSNLGIALLGEIVARVSGQDYAGYIEKNILHPLGMSSSSVQLTDELQNRLATGYGRRLPDGTRKIMPLTDAKGLTPAANMSSTVKDLAKFIALQFRESDPNNDLVLKANSLREMQRIHWLQPDWESGWGLGFSITHRNHRTFVGHGGWVAGYRSQLSFCPEDKIGVVVFINAEDGSPSFLANHIYDTIAPAIRAATKIQPSTTPPPSEWQSYLGRYSDPTDWEYEVMILNDRLVLYGFDYPPEDDPMAGIIELTPIAKHTFRMTGENGNGEKLIFELGTDGNVQRVKMGENFIYPIKR
ncbi:MAG: beta-lactamase family protein [candidate division KSB1 bacterium]|nr:beta-lactamase family protein [candidate division KSB1 bacterium]MDZ7335947.1 beta-lactamase family protein [candidate division KSB1 bacterium]MDZ7357741.1 beta-lactamase family protein [candidate division KSB1 bacterium]MDZ7399862.1 beta-lactamase family protein [candidate division KSB1 bacterium]